MSHSRLPPAARNSHHFSPTRIFRRHTEMVPSSVNGQALRLDHLQTLGAVLRFKSKCISRFRNEPISNECKGIHVMMTLSSFLILVGSVLVAKEKWEPRNLAVVRHSCVVYREIQNPGCSSTFFHKNMA